MDTVSTITYLPLIAFLTGAVAGLVAGRYLTGRGLWVLPVLLSVAALGLIVWLATIGPGEEESAFGPFIALTGGVLPALLSATMGTLGGRALRKRAAR
ncbi:hypothetical protein SAMN05444007_105208 [Cribrihabitans marinus]|uniref:Uncharacterized protein n=1 Tax=Cribrihabitans marinus TaxID=1227549 RepID=A0A1H6ZZD6_9RHOB|nr:hypothetical protein [Cribrihabitans marinus]GGH30261.1 hypothetical protein GCM10010973_20280 [Cribrihabitans marinus]SEJ55112.1 hypothetical protein SAMN05444007_105208 [Cribrihabitans marinus]